MSPTLPGPAGRPRRLPAAHASFPGSNGRIAFNWTFGSDGSLIATIKPDGSDRRLLTADACKEGRPAARRLSRLVGRRHPAGVLQ